MKLSKPMQKEKEKEQVKKQLEYLEKKIATWPDWKRTAVSYNPEFSSAACAKSLAK